MMMMMRLPPGARPSSAAGWLARTGASERARERDRQYMYIGVAAGDTRTHPGARRLRATAPAPRRPAWRCYPTDTGAADAPSPGLC
eukprot:scaffold571_cov364-Prasinococcus_capsulatus_cf.AAC.16